MRRARIALALAGASLVAWACSSYDATNGSDGGADGGAEGAAPPPPGEAGAPDAADAGPRCKGDHGPTPIPVGAYCIDSTEVTGHQYTEFLAAIAGQPPVEPPECAWSTGHTTGAPVGDNDSPIGFTTWCDARAYCAWAGKRLCGRIGGGAAPSEALANAFADEWFAACSHGGERAFPYGPTFEAGACAVPVDGGNAIPGPAKDHPKCEGGYPGIFDMSGNYWEWELTCGDGGADAGCIARGGSYGAFNPGDCSQAAGIRRDRGGVNDIGIRCCSDLAP